MAAKKTPVSKVLIYKDAGGDWRWSAVSANGRKVADSGEGYRNRSYTLKMARDLYPGAEIEWAAR